MKTSEKKQKEKPRNRKGEFVPEKASERYVTRPVRRIMERFR